MDSSPLQTQKGDLLHVFKAQSRNVFKKHLLLYFLQSTARDKRHANLYLLTKASTPSAVGSQNYV